MRPRHAVPVAVTMLASMALARAQVRQSAEMIPYAEHHGAVTVAAFTADGSLLVTGGTDCTLRAWETTGYRLRWLVRTPATPEAMALSSNGRTAAVATRGGGVALCRIGADTPPEILRPAGSTRYTPRIRSVAVSADGRRLATTDDQHFLTLWDVEHAKIVRCVPGCRAVAFTPDGRALVAAATDSISTIDAVTGAVRSKVATSPGDPVGVTPDATMLLTVLREGGRTDYRTTCVATATGQAGNTIKAVPLVAYGELTSIGFAPGSRRVAFYDSGYGLVTADLQSGSFTYDDALRRNVPDVVALADDGRVASALGDSLTVRSPDKRVLFATAPERHDVTDLLFLPDGRLVCGFRDGAISLWRTSPLEYVRTLEHPSGGLQELKLSPDGATLAALLEWDEPAASGPKRLRRAVAWDTGNWAAQSAEWRLAEPKQHLAFPSAHTTAANPRVVLASDAPVVRSRDGRRTATVEPTGRWSTVTVTDTLTRLRLWSADASSLPVFAQGNANVILGTWEGDVQERDADTGAVLTTFHAHDAPVGALALDPSGRILATGDTYGAVRLWRRADHRLLATVDFVPGKAAEGELQWVATTPDGRYAGSAGLAPRLLWRVGNTIYAAQAAGRVAELPRDAGRLDIRADEPAAPAPVRVEQPEPCLNTLAAGSVAPLAVSKDGSRAITGTDRGFQVWDMASGAIIRHLPSYGPGWRSGQYAISADGGTVLVLGPEPLVTVYDTVAPPGARPVRWVQDASNQIQHLALSGDGRLLASDGARLRLQDARTGATRWAQDRRGFAALALSPDGKLLACAPYPPLSSAPAGQRPFGVAIFDATTGAEIRQELGGASHPLAQLLFSPDGARLAEAGWADGGTAGNIVLKSARDGDVAYVLDGRGPMSFSPDGSRLAASCAGDGVRVYDTHLSARPGWVSGDYPAFILVSNDRLLLSSGSTTMPLFGVAAGKAVRSLAAATPYIGRLAVDSASGDIVGLSNKLCVWSGATGALKEAFPGAPAYRNQTAGELLYDLSPSGLTMLSSLSGDGRVVAWRIAAPGSRGPGSPPWTRRSAPPRAKPTPILVVDARTGTAIRTVETTDDTQGGFALNADGSVLALCARDGARLIDVRTDAALGTLAPAESGVGVARVAFSPDGRRAAGLTGRALTVWDVASRAVVARPEVDASDVRGVDLSPDGRYVAALVANTVMRGGGSVLQFEVRLWDARTGEMVRRLVWDTPVVLRMAFSPDGSLLAMSGGTLASVWDPHTGRMLCTLRLDDSPSTAAPGILADIGGSCAFAPNGRRLYTACPDGTIGVWEMPSGRRLASLLRTEEGEWLTVTHEGYYAASEHGTELLSWKVGDEWYPAEKYAARFHRPDLVRKALAD